MVNMSSSRLVFLVLSAVLFVLVSSSQSTEENMEKRGWKDMGNAWGKRGWSDMQGTWGKRGWEKMNNAWGKRATPEDLELEELLAGIDKRPDAKDWSKLKGSWGKRAAGGWSNLKGLWGKRSWDKMNNAWGKRSVADNELAV